MIWVYDELSEFTLEQYNKLLEYVNVRNNNQVTETPSRPVKVIEKQEEE